MPLTETLNKYYIIFDMSVFSFQVLQERFDETSSILDLSHFHMASPFVEKDILPVLYDKMIMRQVLTVIKKNLTNLQGIALNKNNLSFSHICILVDMLKQYPLAAINVEDNNINNLEETCKLFKDFPLYDLKLARNSLFTKVKDRREYFKCVQSYLPQVRYLDGEDVHSYLSDLCVPSTSSETNNESGSVNKDQMEHEVKSFMSQYYTLFDSDKRLELTAAYTPDARIDIESAVAVVPSGQCSSLLGIERALKSIPKTKHVTELLNLEIVQLEQTRRQVRVTGQVYVEGHDSVLSFIHELNIVPYNAGFGCENARLLFNN